MHLETAEWGNYQEWCNYATYLNWIGPNNWEQTPMMPKNKGSFEKGGNRNPIGTTLRTDPGGKAYQDSDLDLKTNERSAAQNMPLLSESTRYADWKADARRWAWMLYSRPISMGVDYFGNNLNDNKLRL